MRRIACALAVLASLAMVVVWAARVDLSSPLSPETERAFHGDSFSAVFGSGAAAADRLRMTSAGEDFTSLESMHPTDIDAENFPTLRYRFEDFPRTLELSLVFRTAENPEDVAISLPWPGTGVRTFDLSRVREWRGHIVELGFAEFPTAQLVPPALGFAPFGIVEADLWSRSWRGDLAALATDWFGAWPWTQRSVHALGRDTDTPRARPLVVCVALAAAIVIFWLAIVFGWRTRSVHRGAVVVIAIAWVLLDVAWQAGLWARVETTRAVYAPLSWSAREKTVADDDIAGEAQKLGAMLHDEPATSRILVAAGPNGGYELLRFIWHLLPRNVAVYAYAGSVGDALPEGCLVVFFDSDDWKTNPVWRQRLAHSEHLRSSDSIYGDAFDDDRVVVFRFHHGH